MRIALALICSGCCISASPTTRSALPSTRPALNAIAATAPSAPQADQATVTEVEVFPGAYGPWYFTIRPDGSALMQYGSTFGDSASLPKGTLDFRAVVAEVAREQLPAAEHGPSAAALVVEGVQSTVTRYLRDDSYFRKLVSSANGKWQSLNRTRFDQLRHAHPIYSQAADGDR